MRKLVVSQFLTLDGVMEAPERWSFAYWTEEIGLFKRAELFASDALLLGRATYDIFAATWPSQSDAAVADAIDAGGGAVESVEFSGFADRMNSMPKFVVSSSLARAEWRNSTIIKGNVVEEVAKLKAQPGKHLLVTGSAQLVTTLMEHNMVDEFRLLIYPFVAGAGKRLFGEGSTLPLRLVESQGFSTGVIGVVYRAQPA